MPRRLRHALIRLEAGEALGDLADEFEIPPAELRRWRERTAGVAPTQLDRVFELERENERLQQLVRALRLDKYMLEQLLESRA
jgi:putative transposase